MLLIGFVEGFPYLGVLGSHISCAKATVMVSQDEPTITVNHLACLH